MFELARTDVDLRWWTGSERFLGTDPPKRLLAWPELRRVSETRTPRPLMELPTSGAAVDPGRFTVVTEQLLTRTPLTDLATLTRATPPFGWTQESLALLTTHSGRTIVSRALALLPERAVDVALGRATKQLFAAKAVRALVVAVDLLRDRALSAAAARLVRAEPDPITLGPDQDAAVAIGLGAQVATEWIAQTGGGFGEAERRAMLQVLAPATHSATLRDMRALIG
jgi:hypothetical protein